MENHEDSSMLLHIPEQCHSFLQFPLLYWHYIFLESTIRCTNLRDNWWWQRTCIFIELPWNKSPEHQVCHRTSHHEKHANKYNNPTVRKLFKINLVAEPHREPPRISFTWIQAAIAPTEILMIPNIIETIEVDVIVSKCLLYKFAWLPVISKISWVFVDTFDAFKLYITRPETRKAHETIELQGAIKIDRFNDLKDIMALSC